MINAVMCAGLSIVASDEIGAVPDLVKHGENGYTFKAGHVDNLTEYLQVLCDDVVVRERMGRCSKEMIDNWSYEQVVVGILYSLDSL